MQPSGAPVSLRQKGSESAGASRPSQSVRASKKASRSSRSPPLMEKPAMSGLL